MALISTQPGYGFIEAGFAAQRVKCPDPQSFFQTVVKKISTVFHWAMLFGGWINNKEYFSVPSCCWKYLVSLKTHTFSSTGTQCVISDGDSYSSSWNLPAAQTFSASKHFFPEQNTHFTHSSEEATAVVWVTQHATPASNRTVQGCSIFWPKVLQLWYLKTQQQQLLEKL